MMKRMRSQRVRSRLATFHKRQRSLKAKRAAKAEVKRIDKAIAAEVEDDRIRIVAVREAKHQAQVGTVMWRSVGSACAERRAVANAERRAAEDAFNYGSDSDELATRASDRHG